MSAGGTTTQRGLFRKKPVDAFVAETGPDAEGGELSRSIGLFTLTMFGVGATIGTGIFIVLTEAVPEAGPGGLRGFDRKSGVWGKGGDLGGRRIIKKKNSPPGS